ncbi:thioredoxin-like protein [Westerdykella ornata]|uniref:Glutathione S-transferase kappa n=1 Tax=Westerdykella ornata TaxID=318751 RepID=A0A6A6JIG3_WESOR|nr:thioredoxin-like protein [Westerdykella ornata]KAF2276004.1 thioredoxin-like protein [Westerdykella ornata]
MAGKITAYLDCVSLYSWFALLQLEKNREKLASHNVELDIVPVFLGGINVGSGNKPPWTLPAKGKYGKYDVKRAMKYFGTPNMKTPKNFPILSLLPQRALVFIKTKHPNLLVPTLLDFFRALWEDGLDISKPDQVAQVLSKRYSEADVCEILEKANSPECKQALNDNTKEALAKGAFGCPWFIVKNSKGEEEPFFGSDRFHYIWDFLQLPWKDFELLPGQARLWQSKL